MVPLFNILFSYSIKKKKKWLMAYIKPVAKQQLSKSSPQSSYKTGKFKLRAKIGMKWVQDRSFSSRLAWSGSKF